MLHYAAYNNHLEIMRCLLDKIPHFDRLVKGEKETRREKLWVIDAETDSGVTPLWLASQQGHVEGCKLLISNGKVLMFLLSLTYENFIFYYSTASPRCEDECSR